ncbi:prolipoprotein diacylglyceryl transferase [Myxococcaceae bacterium JPH2]|nr:prolipoprotein diacylglyceryl transferase [Myxococcaceae bacterium JPH2]
MNPSLLHEFSPSIVRLSDTLSLQWSGAAELTGLLLAFVWLKHQAARGAGPFAPAEVSGFVLYTGLLGVVLGGHAGAVLLHQWDDFSRDGTLSFLFHESRTSVLGVLAGVLACAAFHARQRQRSWLQVTDALVLLAPVGLLLWHLAAFTEGEPLGRVSHVPWALRFPTELNVDGFQPVAPAALDLAPLAHAPGYELARLARENPRLAEEFLRILPPRHPVLLYQAALEGCVLLALLWAARTRWPSARPGVMTGLFFVLYGGLSWASTPFLEPDLNLPLSYQFEQGVLLSLLLLAVGAAFLLEVLGQRRVVAPTSQA